jgi:hypothetical protein
MAAEQFSSIAKRQATPKVKIDRQVKWVVFFMAL